MSSPLTREDVESLPLLPGLWLQCVAEAGHPVACHYFRFARGLARNADYRLAVITDEHAWKDHLRRDCGLSWHPGALQGNLARFAARGWARKLENHLWMLTVPSARIGKSAPWRAR